MSQFVSGHPVHSEYLIVPARAVSEDTDLRQRRCFTVGRTNKKSDKCREMHVVSYVVWLVMQSTEGPLHMALWFIFKGISRGNHSTATFCRPAKHTMCFIQWRYVSLWDCDSWMYRNLIWWYLQSFLCVRWVQTCFWRWHQKKCLFSKPAVLCPVSLHVL